CHLTLSSLKSGSFNARVQGLKILIASDVLHLFKKYRLDGADQRKALQLHLRNSTKQVAVFLKRPICQDAGAREHKQFSSFISTLEEWLRMARKVMKKYAKNTSDSEESSGEEDEAESGEETEE
ncbi:hypothetical protein PMAYCL1PPCAC_20716, partial [Pristionchus mayeri]